MKIYRISTLKFYPYDPDGENEELNAAGHDENEALDSAEEAFLQSKINVGRDKTVSRLIEINGEIAGAIYSKLEPDEEGWRYSFDIAIHPQMRAKQNTGLGEKTILHIIDEAMKDYESYKNELGNVYCYVWAVNPKLANILERRYGFQRENYNEEGQATLIKY